jgi:DNA polymerase II small subunit/DNA polymerase delta subunit B
METLSFAFGMLTMIGLLFAVVIVMGIVKGNKNENQINGLTDHIEDLDRTFHEKVSDCNRWIDERTLMVDRRVDQEIDRTNRNHEDVIKYIDSRIDKLETKLTGTTGAKQVLKG